MTKPSVRDLVHLAHNAGYRVESAQQLRPNRWLLTLRDEADATTIALFQARPLIGAADVQDLAELARLRRPDHCVLVACDGSFSPAARRTLAELTNDRLQLCTALPPAQTSDGDDA